MRTTLTIDDDVLTAVRDRARREHRSAGDVLSELAREALVAGPPPPSGRARRAGARHGFIPLPHRGPPVTREFVQNLLDETDE